MKAHIFFRLLAILILVLTAFAGYAIGEPETAQILAFTPFVGAISPDEMKYLTALKNAVNKTGAFPNCAASIRRLRNIHSYVKQQNATKFYWTRQSATNPNQLNSLLADNDVFFPIKMTIGVGQQGVGETFGARLYKYQYANPTAFTAARELIAIQQLFESSQASINLSPNSIENLPVAQLSHRRDPNIVSLVAAPNYKQISWPDADLGVEVVLEPDDVSGYWMQNLGESEVMPVTAADVYKLLYIKGGDNISLTLETNVPLDFVSPAPTTRTNVIIMDTWGLVIPNGLTQLPKSVSKK